MLSGYAGRRPFVNRRLFNGSRGCRRRLIVLARLPAPAHDGAELAQELGVRE
jgi:hypothetical protein